MSGNQLSLFQEEAPTVRKVGPAPADEAMLALARSLPSHVRFGTSSWAFGGWAGLVYDRVASERTLATEGLRAYAGHPLFRTVSLDRTFYGPVSVDVLAGYAGAVAPGFEFVVKAHEWCTWSRFPDHPRYGAQRGSANPLYLDPGYALQTVIEPALAGLGHKLGVVLFQFPPQSLELLGQRRGFARDVARFFAGLPRGPRYAVEFRTHQLLCAPVLDVLRGYGVACAYSAHPAMPTLAHQRKQLEPHADAFIVVRWMLAPHYRYEHAKATFAPFDRLVEPDPRTRTAIADIIAVAEGRPVYVIVNNKAEGSAPLSIEQLARACAAR